MRHHILSPQLTADNALNRVSPQSALTESRFTCDCVIVIIVSTFRSPIFRARQTFSISFSPSLLPRAGVIDRTGESRLLIVSNLFPLFFLILSNDSAHSNKLCATDAEMDTPERKYFWRLSSKKRKRRATTEGGIKIGKHVVYA